MFDFMELDFATNNDQDFSGPYLPSASECLRCGLCVSHCPTYKLFQDDAQTPRNRVRTIEKVLDNQTISTEQTEALNACLLCRACEPACPSKMAYGYFFDQAQAKLEKRMPILAKLGFWFIEHKRWLRSLMPFLWLYQKSHLSDIVRKTGVLKKLHLADAEALLTAPALNLLSTRYPATGNKRGQVALFTGCVAEHFDRSTLESAIRLLTVIGFDVLIPSNQSCCGAIHQHNGLSARQFIENNLKVFNTLDVEAVIYTATGCGAMLSEYSDAGDAEGQRFQQRLFDINTFLLAHWPADLSLNPLVSTVAVHEPCSQHNVLQNQQAVYDLLAKIPKLNVQALPDNDVCCGAGGSYMLSYPNNAQQLRNRKIALLDEINPDYLVSSNYACAAFLSAGPIKPMAIIHPMTLLARQL